MWVPKFLKKKTKPQIELHYNWTPMTSAFGNCVSVDKPQKVGGTVVAKVLNDVQAFQSTAASQWSTSGVVTEKRLLEWPFHLIKDYYGNIIGIRFHSERIKSQIEDWKTLIQNPILLKRTIRNRRQRTQAIKDSALFL